MIFGRGGGTAALWSPLFVRANEAEQMPPRRKQISCGTAGNQISIPTSGAGPSTSGSGGRGVAVRSRPPFNLTGRRSAQSSKTEVLKGRR